MVGWSKERIGGSMLDKLIAYLKNLPEEEQKKLLDALQVEQTTEQDNEQEKESTAEEAQAEQVEESTTDEQVKESETTEQTEEEQTEETSKEQEVENVEEKEEEQTDNEQVEETEQQEQPVQEQADEPTNQESTEETSTVSQDLLDTKIELALVKAGIREDRLEAAKRLFKTEIHSLEELDKLNELVKEFPEWQAKKEHGKGFGVPIKDSGTSLTEEEKKLKNMGIDPKN